MDYISICKWEKHQHYKDRRPKWIKLEIDIIEEFDADGMPKKFYDLPDSAKLTFICLLCLRANYNNKIPYKSDKWLSTRLGISHIDLQPLVSSGYIVIDTETVSEPYQDSIVSAEVNTPETERETERETEKRGVIRHSCFSLPDSISQEDWNLFLAHRKSVKAPVTKEAYPTFIEKFLKLKDKGFEPHFVITTMVERSWRWFKPEWIDKQLTETGERKRNVFLEGLDGNNDNGR